MKKRLLLDVDEVICFPGFLQAVNEFMNTSYEIDDFTDYFIDEIAIPKDKFKEFNEFLSKKNLYENATLLPNSYEVIEKLNNIYDVYICSSCINPLNINDSGRIFKDKYDFLIEKFPFLDPNKFIFTSSKYLFNADIQIDDRLNNLKSNAEIKILFPSYHNKDIKDFELEKNNVIRAGYDWKNGFKEIEKILIK